MTIIDLCKVELDQLNRYNFDLSCMCSCAICEMVRDKLRIDGYISEDSKGVIKRTEKADSYFYGDGVYREA